MKAIVSGLAFSAALLGLAASASAQTPAAAPAGEKLIGDWRISCTGPAQAPCVMQQVIANKATGQQVMATSVIYLPSNGVHLLQIFLPLGVSIPRGVQIKSDSFTSPKLQFQACEPQGSCVVALPLNQESVTNLSRAGSNTQVVFAFDGGQDVLVRMSLNGFADADAYMAEQAKAKTKSAPAAPSVINGQ